ncbi:MAG TPA: PIG-L deacetylase family protein [Candidatus Dormibacteraeota bacterium]|nr:PIG-L deacetylase family protein [Candidatus Dormibacteraeota bacterium]
MSFEIPRRALIVFAHPDDADFGCSGTVAAWTAEGTSVVYCLLTSGNKGSHDLKATPARVARTREREQRAAAEILGVEKCVFLRHDDGELEVTMALRGEVCRVIRDEKPDLVICPDPWREYQTHPDHRVAGWVGLDGVIAARDHLFFRTQLRGGRTHHRVGRILLFGTAEPNLVVDITSTFDRKLAALHAHASQPHNRERAAFDERMRTFAEAFGKPWGFRAAEAFRYIDRF